MSYLTLAISFLSFIEFDGPLAIVESGDLFEVPPNPESASICAAASPGRPELDQACARAPPMLHRSALPASARSYFRETSGGLVSHSLPRRAGRPDARSNKPARPERSRPWGSVPVHRIHGPGRHGRHDWLPASGLSSDRKFPG